MAAKDAPTKGAVDPPTANSNSATVDVKAIVAAADVKVLGDGVEEGRAALVYVPNCNKLSVELQVLGMGTRAELQRMLAEFLGPNTTVIESCTDDDHDDHDGTDNPPCHCVAASTDASWHRMYAVRLTTKDMRRIGIGPIHGIDRAGWTECARCGWPSTQTDGWKPNEVPAVFYILGCPKAYSRGDMRELARSMIF
jgi:hypothetical protein